MHNTYRFPNIKLKYITTISKSQRYKITEWQISEISLIMNVVIMIVSFNLLKASNLLKHLWVLKNQSVIYIVNIDS